jgi:hypothetical protein
VNRRRLVKIAVLLCSLLLLLTVALGTIMFFELRSVREIGSVLAELQPPVFATPYPSASGGDSPAAETDSRGSESATTAPVPPTKPDRSAISDPVLRYLLERYVDRGSTDINVCAELPSLTAPAPISAQSFQRALDRVASGEVRIDPFVEAALAPLGVLLRNPNVSAALENIANGQADEASIATAAAELVRSAATFDRASQRGYHLFSLAILASERPEFANDSRLLDLCEQIQGAAETAAPNEAQGVIRREKAALLSMLGEIGVTPSQAGFNYNLENNLRAQVTEQSFIVDIPWLRRATDTVFVLVAPSSQPELQRIERGF